MVTPIEALRSLYDRYSSTVKLDMRIALLLRAIPIAQGLLRQAHRAMMVQSRGAGIPADMIKLADKAMKAQRLAASSTWPEEKETALRMALSNMERFAASLNPPRVSDAKDKLDTFLKSAPATAQRAPRATTATPGAPSTPKAPRAPAAPGKFPPVVNGVMQFRPGSNFRFLADFILSRPQTTPAEAAAALRASGISCANIEGRVNQMGSILSKAGLIRKVGKGNNVVFEKV